jgi:hypothetical protein
MATITFLPDHEGNKKALQFIDDIRKKALQGNKYYEELLVYIVRGFDHLRQYGVNPEYPDTFFTTSKIGETSIITFQLTKPLRYHPPLWEMRINLRPSAFRAVFFPFKKGDDSQILFFTHAMLKTQTSSLAFGKLIEESEKIVQDFFANPRKYLRRRE